MKKNISGGLDYLSNLDNHLKTTCFNTDLY